jgi:hypothetical protein
VRFGTQYKRREKAASTSDDTKLFENWSEQADLWITANVDP